VWDSAQERRPPPIGGCASVSFHGRMMPRMMALRCRSAMARRASPGRLLWRPDYGTGSQSEACLRLV
jgi:hypothetical protein